MLFTFNLSIPVLLLNRPLQALLRLFLRLFLRLSLSNSRSIPEL